MNREDRSSGLGWRRRGAWVMTLALLTLLGACNSNGGSGTDIVGVGPDRFIDEVFRFTAETDIQYGAAVGESGMLEPLLLDLYQPQDDDEPLRPAILWLHGGGFTRGHKGEMTDYARRFARRGYVSVAIDYRLRPNTEFDYADLTDPVGEAVKLDAQHDAQAAVRWLRANAQALRIDPNRIIVAGYSAGGVTAIRLALRPGDAGSSGTPGYSSNVAGAVAISGSLDSVPLGSTTVPILFLHGLDDTKVRPEGIQTACAGAALCTFVGIAGAEHTMITSQKERIIPETARFAFDRVIGR